MFNQITRIFSKYKFICSWCETEFGEAEVTNSHGTCPKCKKEQLELLAALIG